MGLATGCACVLLIGWDRMISVMCTLQYRNFKKKYYHRVRFFLLRRNQELSEEFMQVVASLIVIVCVYFSYPLFAYRLER